MADAKRQAAGWRSKESGQLFEKWIQASCDYYLGKGIAFVEKTPEPFHVLGREKQSGGFYGFFEKKGQPDFKGILCDGTGIMFEAKHTDSGRIKQGVVTQKQWESLDKYQEFGALCYVMVSLNLASFYRVPWEVWKTMKERYGHKYMDSRDLADFRLKEVCMKILIFDGIEIGGNTDEDTEKRAGSED